MADIIKVSQLPETATINGRDLLEVSKDNQNGTYSSRRSTVDTLAAYINNVAGDGANDGIINVLNYLSNTDGTVCQSTQLQTAINAAALKGEHVYIPPGTKILCCESIALSANTGLIGQSYSIADPFIADYNSDIILKETASIDMYENTTINAIRIKSENLQTASVSALDIPNDYFAGTAVKLNGTDTNISNSSIFGFENGIKSNLESSRANIDNMKMDNINSIYLSESNEFSRINNVICKPFCGGAGSSNQIRLGNGIRCSDTSINTIVSNCYVWGYTVGYLIQNPQKQFQLIDNVAEFPFLSDSSTGFKIEGSVTNLIAKGLQTDLTQYGINIDVDLGLEDDGNVVIDSCLFNRATWGTNVVNGDCQISNSHFIGSIDSIVNPVGQFAGVNIENPDSNVICENNYFQNWESLSAKAVNFEGAVSGERLFTRNMFKNVNDRGDDNSIREEDTLAAIGIVKAAATDPDVIALITALEDNYFS